MLAHLTQMLRDRAAAHAALTPDQAQHAQQLYDAGDHTVQRIADLLKVPRSTVYGHLNKSGIGRDPPPVSPQRLSAQSVPITTKTPMTPPPCQRKSCGKAPRIFGTLSLLRAKPAESQSRLRRDHTPPPKSMPP